MVVSNRSSKVGLCLLCIWTAVALDIYPWGKYDFKEHSEQLLDGMRNYEHLKAWESTITPSFGELDGMLLRNNEGNTFQLNVKDEKSKEKQKSSFDRTNFSELMETLQDNCALLIDGYWSYEWCHGKEVKQFHLQEQKKKGTFKRIPEWSLGKHRRLVTIREKKQTDSNAEAKERPISKLIEYFEDGQPCDETGSGRATTVHTMCCEGTGHKNYIAADVYYAVKEAPPDSSNLSGAKLPVATISSIEEPSLCKYEMVVCTPLLCPRPAATSPPRTGTGASTVPLMDADTPQLAPVMKFINSTCLTKQEDWWTYELCFNAGLRQVRYDIEQSVTPEGRILQKNTLVSQYQLGTAPLDLYGDETTLKQHVIGSDSTVLSATELAILRSAGMVTPAFRTRGRAPRYLTLGFEDGTPCDLDAINRSTVVDLYCGPKNRLVSIWEDSTCHYHAKVELAILCSFEDFVPYKENTTVVEFTAYDPADTDLPAVEPDSAAADTEVDLSAVEPDSAAADTEVDLPAVEPDSAAADTEEDLFPDSREAETEVKLMADGNFSEFPTGADGTETTEDNLHQQMENPLDEAEAVHTEAAAVVLLPAEEEGVDVSQESPKEQRRHVDSPLQEEAHRSEEQPLSPVLTEAQQPEQEEEFYDLALDLAHLRLQFPVDFDMARLVTDFEQAQWQHRQQHGGKSLTRRDAERMIEQLIGAGGNQEEALNEEQEVQSDQAHERTTAVEVSDEGEQR